MKKRLKSGNIETIGVDILFLGSFLIAIGSSIGAFLDILFVVPMLVSFFVWLGLTLMVLRRIGVSLRAALLERRLVSGLPLNKKLHVFYIATLLVSLMLFFALILVGRGLHALLAFVVWIFIGSQVTQELSTRADSKKEDRTVKR